MSGAASPKDNAVGCGALLLLFAAMSFAFSFCSKSEDMAPCDDETMAYVMMQGFVEARLRAPSTARFPSMAREGVRVRKTGECTFSVAGYVDAQNGFGAQIRTSYAGEVEAPRSGDRWILKDLVIL